MAAISAFVLDRPSAPKASDIQNTEVKGFPVKMTREEAQLVLLGVYFVAGLMAYVATESTLTILSQLSSPIRSAACTQASIVTSAVGYRVIAAVLPILFVLPILWRHWKGSRSVSLKDSREVVALLGFFMLPYLALGSALLRVKCDT